MLKVPLTISPQVAFDLRDWYQETFVAPQISDGSRTPNFTRSIVRVNGQVSLLASPLNPPDPNWPFSQTVELVTREAPNGIRSFFGRFQTPNNVLVNRLASRINKAAKCQLAIRATGYQSVTLPSFEIPGPNGSPVVTPPISLFPAADYPFPGPPRPIALLEGSVRRIDGTGVTGATANAKDPGGGADPIFQSTTGTDGRYLVVMDSLLAADGTVTSSKVEITLNHSSWSAPITRTLSFPGQNGKFTPPRRSVFSTTVFRGSVLLDGRPISGARVSLRSDDQPLLNGSVRTNTYGNWEIYGDARLPLTGEDEATITASAHNKSGDLSFVVHYGQQTSIAPISLS